MMGFRRRSGAENLLAAVRKRMRRNKKTRTGKSRKMAEEPATETAGEKRKVKRFEKDIASGKHFSLSAAEKRRRAVVAELSLNGGLTR